MIYLEENLIASDGTSYDVIARRCSNSSDYDIYRVLKDDFGGWCFANRLTKEEIVEKLEELSIEIPRELA